jgi:hypothetical protein
MHKPKETKEIYVDSLSVNSSNLEKQLQAKSVSEDEIKRIIKSIDAGYMQRLEGIVHECDKDMMALERVPSPLRLFIDCLEESERTMQLSQESRQLVLSYVSAWEDWM